MRKTAAIVGRPNVGKSALFNRIVGKRISIVHDMPGVTRDRVSAEVEFRGKSFTLVDTGGIGLVRGQKSEDVILTVAMAQVDAAIEAAEVIIMVVNAQEGVVPMDVEVAKKLHASGKKVLLAANKVDNANHEKLVDEFAELGFNGIFGTSAIHGRGIDPLLKELCQGFPRNAESQAAEKPNPSDEEDPASQEPFKLAIVAARNVGKSSLVNALTQSERVVVSEIPGTTRDAVDVPLKIEGEGEVLDLILIDTAGLRKKRRINDSIEFFSSKRTEDSIERCDLVVFVIDADHGIHEQDKKIADLITASHKACIIVVNKWDLVAEAVEKAKKEQNLKRKTMKPSDFAASREISSLNEFAEWVQKQLFFMSYAPVIFSSAKTGFHLDRLIEAVRFVKDQWRQAVPTGIFNRVLQDIIQSRPISSKSGNPCASIMPIRSALARPHFCSSPIFPRISRIITGAIWKVKSGGLLASKAVPSFSRTRPAQNPSTQFAGPLKNHPAEIHANHPDPLAPTPPRLPAQNPIPPSLPQRAGDPLKNPTLHQPDADEADPFRAPRAPRRPRLNNKVPGTLFLPDFLFTDLFLV
ncbi:MAG: ribosome biogenesis GTPase Der [Verrucomicrobia bacterium]|nr:ribosome biogenesis GTPase Der [Verrucomicrobiota bacterium]